MRDKLKNFIENPYSVNFILAIIINSVILGLMTYPRINEECGNILNLICDICLFIYTIEIGIKLIAYGKSFFKDAWNVFDFILVAISLVPTGTVFASLRAFRVLRALRALRLISGFGKLRIIVKAIIESVPDVGWASVLLLLIFYIFSIMGTTMFSATFPEFFGSIGKSMFSLFQIMTLESWSMGIARPVSAIHPYARIYFIAFILVSSFIVMNVIVGVIVNAIGEISSKEKKESETHRIKSSTDLESELENLKRQITVVEELLKDKIR